MFARDMLTHPAGVLSPEDMFTLLKNSGLIDSNRTIEDVMRDSKSFLEKIEKDQLENHLPNATDIQDNRSKSYAKAQLPAKAQEETEVEEE